MDRSDRTERMAARVAFFVLAEGQPEEDIFGAAFSVVRQDARDFKEQHEELARQSLQDSLINDLKQKGYKVVSANVVLGKYRGSRFVTSAKVAVTVKDARDAKVLEGHLKRYHHRYHLKTFDQNTRLAEYNIR